MKKKIIIFLSLILLISLTSYVAILLIKSKLTDSDVAENDSDDKEDVNEVTEVERESLSDLINQYLIEKNSDNEIAIYVNELNGDNVFEYNANQYFFAASLYKVPLAMVYYDLINEGNYQLSDVFLYEEYHYEVGGPIGETYEFGSYIRLDTLLNYMIVYSDNSAAHILFENLGGWIEFKRAITKYSNQTYDDTFFSYENVMSASYLNDVLHYLYKNEDMYQTLINNMKIPSEYNYLSLDGTLEVAQKYGYYEEVRNSMGIIYGDTPYSIVVLTTLGDSADIHIHRINEICYEYYHS